MLETKEVNVNPVVAEELTADGLEGEEDDEEEDEFVAVGDTEARIVTDDLLEVTEYEADFLKHGKILALVKDVETRWNSTYGMMRRI